MARILTEMTSHDMDVDAARRVLAKCFNSRKDRDSMTRSDLVREIAYKNRMLPETSVDKFLQGCVEAHLLKHEGDLYAPTFSTSGVIIPLDFSVDEESLFQERRDVPLTGRILEKVIASGRITKKALNERVEEIQRYLQYVPYEFVLATVAMEEQVDISEFLEELGQNGKRA